MMNLRTCMKLPQSESFLIAYCLLDMGIYPNVQQQMQNFSGLLKAFHAKATQITERMTTSSTLLLNESTS
eukprot:1201841-Amphidinium_carterae.1